MQKTRLPQAIYHGTNSLAKENYRESLALVMSHRLSQSSDVMGMVASTSGRWRFLYPHLWRQGRRHCASLGEELRRVSQLKRGYVRAIVLCDARHELVQGAVVFPVDLAACASRVLAVILCKRRLYREFPCFFAFVLYEIAQFVLLFALYSVSGGGEQYAYAFSATLLFSIALRFGVIDEVSRDLFRESQFLKASARRLLLCVAGLLLAIAVLLAVYAPGSSSARWHAGVSIVNRGAAMVQCGLLLSLLLFSRFLGVSWRRPTFGITLGLGVLTSVDLATSALRAEFTSDVTKEFLNLLITGASFICVSIWIGYLLAPESEPVSLAVVPHHEKEIETWNTELQRLLRD